MNPGGGGVVLASVAPSTSSGGQGAFSFASPSQAPPVRPQLMQDRTLAQPGDLAPAPPSFQPYYLRPAYRFKPTTVLSSEGAATGAEDSGPGRRLRRSLANVRRHVDYTANILTHLEARLWQRDWRDRRMGAPDLLYSRDILPAASWKERPIDCVLTKFLRAAMNKIKCPIYDICWTPEGRRLITGASTGEFTLWNGTAFNFETILQAHDTAIRALKWTHGEKWLVSADHDGFVKYWQANMNNVHMYQAHKEAVRSISFSCTDVKMATGSDDGTVRIWDFGRCVEERILRGHGSDVRSVDWHPQKGLVASASRDSQQPVKIWDPKTAQCLATLHDHKNSAMAVQWNRNGNWLLSASRDHLIKLYDIRMMRELRTFRGHRKEVTAVAWHPVHEGLFVSGGGDGSLAYWLASSDKEAGLIEHAHDQAIWTLQWHPLGHILASGSNDNNTKFWTRNKPGDLIEDFHGMVVGPVQGGTLSGPNSTTHMRDKVPETPGEKLARNQAMQEAERVKAETEKMEEASGASTQSQTIPGMGLDQETLESLRKVPLTVHEGLPGLGATLFPENPIPTEQTTGVGAKKTLIKQPPPKKAQRQLERVWNANRAMGASDHALPEEEGAQPETGASKRGKKSLLGRAPPAQGPMEPSFRPQGPPGGPRPPLAGGTGPGWPGPPQMGTGGGGPQGFGGPPSRPPLPPPGPPPPGMFPGGGVRPSMAHQGMMGMSNASMNQPWTQQQQQPQPPPQPLSQPPIPPSQPQSLPQSRDVDYRYQAAPPQSQSGDTDMRGWGAPGPSAVPPPAPVDEDWRAAGAAAVARDPRQRRREETTALPPQTRSRDPRDPRDTRRGPQGAQQSGQEEESRKRNWMGSYADLGGDVDITSDSPITKKDPRR